jgi:hypothetical protein
MEEVFDEIDKKTDILSILKNAPGYESFFSRKITIVFLRLKPSDRINAW